MAPSSSRPLRHNLYLLVVSISVLLASVPALAAGGWFISPLASAASAALCPFPFAIFLELDFPHQWFCCNWSDGLPELGGDGLHREILRDETVMRLKELGKVRPSIHS